MRLNQGQSKEVVAGFRNFANWVLDIGNDKVCSPLNGRYEVVEDDIIVPAQFCDPEMKNDVGNMIQWTYPDFLSINKISVGFAEDLKEGDVYTISNFKVKKYEGDETNRAVRMDKHIYFDSETKFEHLKEDCCNILNHSFNLCALEDLAKYVTDNRYLIDVIGVVDTANPSCVFSKEDQKKSHLKFKITNGSNVVGVTFFNEFAESFEKAFKEIAVEHVIVIIACAKVNKYDVITLQKNVSCQVFVKKVEEKNNWYVNVGEGINFPPLLKQFEKKEFIVILCPSEENIKKLCNVYLAKKVSHVPEKTGNYIPIVPQTPGNIQISLNGYECLDRRFSCRLVPGLLGFVLNSCSSENDVAAAVPCFPDVVLLERRRRWTGEDAGLDYRTKTQQNEPGIVLVALRFGSPENEAAGVGFRPADLVLDRPGFDPSKSVLRRVRKIPEKWEMKQKLRRNMKPVRTRVVKKRVKPRDPLIPKVLIPIQEESFELPEQVEC
ncbi:hypothetical protein AgCh_016439 [Apium graveolens]